MGCALSIIGAVIIILHAPEEKQINSVDQILYYAMQPGMFKLFLVSEPCVGALRLASNWCSEYPGFVMYVIVVVTSVFYLIYRIAPRYGRRNMMVYVGICSLIGSISVMACKGVGITLKLTLEGNNQLRHPSTYFLVVVAAVGLLTQMNFFNKALDQFSTNLVTPIYYVLFTTATITASAILFQGFYNTNVKDVVSVFAGFLTIFIGVFLLNHVKEPPTHVPPPDQHTVDIYDDEEIQFSPTVSASFTLEEGAQPPTVKSGSLGHKNSVGSQFAHQYTRYTDDGGSTSLPRPTNRKGSTRNALQKTFSRGHEPPSDLASSRSATVDGFLPPDSSRSNATGPPQHSAQRPRTPGAPVRSAAAAATKKTSSKRHTASATSSQPQQQSSQRPPTEARPIRGAHPSTSTDDSAGLHSVSAPSIKNEFTTPLYALRRSSDDELTASASLIPDGATPQPRRESRHGTASGNSSDVPPAYAMVANDGTS